MVLKLRETELQSFDGNFLVHCQFGQNMRDNSSYFVILLLLIKKQAIV